MLILVIRSQGTSVDYYFVAVARSGTWK